jgi:hypothetical protein
MPLRGARSLAHADQRVSCRCLERLGSGLRSAAAGQVLSEVGTKGLRSGGVGFYGARNAADGAG